MPANRLVPKPTVFLLFGATGDLAHRLVLPAFFRLAQAGLLPTDWRLVGNGRGDASHEDFRERVRQSLEEFGPKPSQGPWKDFQSRLRFAGGGFGTSDPGNLLDVLGEAEKDLGGGPSTRPLFGRAALGVRPAHRGHRRSRLDRAVPGRLRETLRHLAEDLRATGQGGPRRVPGATDLPHRPFPRERGHPVHPHGSLRQRPVLRHLGPPPHRVRADRRPRDPGRGDAGRLLRRDRRHPRHARHPPLPIGGRGGHGNPEIPRRRAHRRRAARRSSPASGRWPARTWSWASTRVTGT